MAKQNNQKVFTERYNQAYLLCAELLSKKLQAIGKDAFSRDHNLIQSVLASLPVIDLIMQHDFSVVLYKPVLITAIEETRKELFPDLAKKRFIALDKLAEINNPEEPKVKLEISNHSKHENNIILRGLPEKSKVYIEKILKANPDGSQHLRIKNNRKLINKVSLISVLFPDQKVPEIQSCLDNKTLTENQIINIYKCVLAGIEKHFPQNFLKTQSKFKAKVLIRFLFNDVLKIEDPENFLTIDKDLFADYKLQNVLRYFNYSVKQLIHNAFPDKFSDWQGGRISNNYWSARQNRISAIRWLVENRLGIDVENAGKILLNKKDFRTHGLSYLFNIYYNSTSKALNEAYPALMPWQIGPLPSAYWDFKNTKEAIFWMIKKLQWKVAELPTRYNNGEITRKTFSQFGLSGLFENKFNCNIYRLANFIWPGKFKEWEFGNMSKNFWDSSENRKKFSLWFANKFQVNMFKTQSSFTSVQQAKEYRFYSSLYRYCNGDFNNLLKSYALDLAEQNKSRLLLRKWDGLIKREKTSIFQSILTNGLYYNLVKVQAVNRIDSFNRMKSRLEKLV